jgi:hypothetical protein
MRKWIMAAPGDPDLLQAVAHHEAGHAVIGYRFRKRIGEPGIFACPSRHGIGGDVQRRLDVLPRDAEWHRSVGGAVWESFKERAEREIIISLAGPMAEARYILGRNPVGFLAGDSPDVQVAKRYLDCLPARDSSSEPYEQVLYGRTRSMLREHRTWGALKELAGMLIARNSVPGEIAEDLFREWRVPRIPNEAWMSAGE